MIHVISGDIDGGDLHRKQAANPRYIRCDGRLPSDTAVLNTACESAGAMPYWGIPAEAWDRIFGKGQPEGERCPLPIPLHVERTD